MVSTLAHLGLSSVFESHSGPVPSGENEFHSKLRQIETGVETFNLDSSVVHIAAEIAAFESSLALESRVALIMLIVASMVALEEGSTRLPVTGEESIDSMRRILEPLCGDQSSDDNVVAIANRIDDLLASGAAETVIGRHGDEYKPLLYIPPFIYHQKVFATESRLVESFRPRFAARRVADIQMGVREALADVDARPSTFDGHEMAISEEQRSVIINATQSGVALISGVRERARLLSFSRSSASLYDSVSNRAKSSSPLLLEEQPFEWGRACGADSGIFGCLHPPMRYWWRNCLRRELSIVYSVILHRVNHSLIIAGIHLPQLSSLSTSARCST